MKRKPVWQDLNPKAVTNDELFGYINPTTREWKDGQLCVIYATCICDRLKEKMGFVQNLNLCCVLSK